MQDVEFITAFMEAMAVTPGSHPKTFRTLHVASLIGSFAALHFKDVFDRPRPSWEYPALMPPIPVPGHSAFPSGHATQAYLISWIMRYVFTLSGMAINDQAALGRTLVALANRVARNREIAGLHYRSDSEAGETLAAQVFAVLSAHTGDGSSPSHYTIGKFGAAVVSASKEWD